MTGRLDDLYFDWLYKQVALTKSSNPSKNYWNLARQLFTTEFVWFVPNDDNRVEDGRCLRYEFIEDLELEDVDPDWMDVGCSMFEMLIGLSRRLSFQANGQPRDWFWHLIDNLRLRNYNDRVSFDSGNVKEVLDTVIWRTYEENGYGGLFPLACPDEDQRDVEIWYQLNAYLLERT